MTHYLLIFIFPFLMTNFVKSSRALENTIFIIFVIYLIIIVGFRFDMGLDWSNYLKEFYDRNILFTYHENNLQTFFNNLAAGKPFANRNIEPLYLLFLKLSNTLFGNIIFFNFVNALLSVGCISFFCFKQEKKWFGLAISMSFIIFYGMDIIRQFTGLGFICLMIYNMSRKNFYYSLIYWLIAIFFHISSIIFVFLYFYIIFNKIKGKLKLIFSVSLFFIILTFLFFNLGKFLENISTNVYVGSENIYLSKGLIFRLILNLFPFVIFIYFNKLFTNSKYYTILNWYSFIYIILAILFIAEVNLTIVDRFVVFLVPYQILIYMHFIKFFNFEKTKNYFILCISSFYLLFAASWMFLSEDNFRVYVPYKSVIWKDYNSSIGVLCYPLKCALEGGDKDIKYE